MFGNAQREKALQDVEVRLGQLEAILDRIDGRIGALERAPVPVIDTDELRATVEAQAGAISERLDDHAGVLNDLESWKKDIVHAVSEGIERTDRAERRIKSSIARARKSLREQGFESDALESEATELRTVDGTGGGEGELQLMPGNMEAPRDERSSIPGVSLETLRRAHGL